LAVFHRILIEVLIGLPYVMLEPKGFAWAGRGEGSITTQEFTPMMYTRIILAASAAAACALFAEPSLATPIAWTGGEAQVMSLAKLSTGVDQVAARYYRRHRYYAHHGWRRHYWGGRPWHGRRYAGCWNCGRGWWRHRHGYGSAFYLSFGIPYYGYGYGYPYYGYGYGYPYYGDPVPLKRSDY
jgi:hypothetical protein